MPNILKLYRSVVAGRRPTVAKTDGEVYVNLADMQFGVYSNSLPVDYLAVRYFSSLAAYAANDYVIQAGVLYAAKAAITPGPFLGSQWNTVAIPSTGGAQYLPLAGGTLTGPLLLNADPTLPLGAATKNYVDGHVSGAVGDYLPLTGGVLSGGLTVQAGGVAVTGASTFSSTITAAGDIAANAGVTMGSVTAASATDLSRHLDLYGGSYGLCVTGSTLNYNSSGGAHAFYGGGAYRGGFDTSGNLIGQGTVYSMGGVFYSRAPTASNNAHIGFQNSAGTVMGWYYWDYASSNMILTKVNGQNISIGASNIAFSGPISCGAITSGAISSGAITTSGNISANGAINCQGSYSMGANGFNGSPGTIYTSGTVQSAQMICQGNFLGQNTHYPLYYTKSDVYQQYSSSLVYEFWQSGWYQYWNATNGNYDWVCNNAFGMELRGSPDFQIGVNGYKPGGGSWAASSDARIKDVERDFKLGLDVILRLNPVVYTYKGNDTLTAEKVYTPPEPDPVILPEGLSLEPGPKGPPIPNPYEHLMSGERAPYPRSPHFHVAASRQRFVGLVAQDVEDVFPDIVRRRKGWIDGREHDDVRDIDPNALIYALVNAVKTLNARVAELEATR